MGKIMIPQCINCKHYEQERTKIKLPKKFDYIKTSKESALPNTDPKAVKLDVGCGYNKRNDSEGWIGVDFDGNSLADITCNIEKGLPFPDNSVDFIFTSHTLEHMVDLIFVMEEFYRVLKKDGILEIIVPYYESSDALRHPDHKRFFNKEIWNFWNPEAFQEDRKSYGVKAMFEVAIDYETGKVLNYLKENGLFVTLRKIQ